MTFERFMIAMMAMFVVIAGFAIYRAEQHEERCNAKGGIVISTPSGRVCAKIERL